jgi:hypothetical protein
VWPIKEDTDEAEDEDESDKTGSWSKAVEEEDEENTSGYKEGFKKSY